MSTQNRLGRNPYARTSGRLAHWCWLFVVLSLLQAAALQADEAGDLKVVDIHTWARGDVRLLDANFAIRLSSGAREALDNGVPLTFELQIQLVKKHRWLWDVVEAEHVLVRELEYHALTRSYLVKDVTSVSQGNYSRLDDALIAAGSIEKLLFTSVPLEPDRNYSIRLRGNLDIEALPTPVRLLAYVSSGWDMSSDWYAWPLDR